MNRKEIIADLLYFPIAIGKGFIKSLIDPKMLFMYGIELRLAIFFIFSVILGGRTPDTMPVTTAYKILLYMMIVFDAYTVLVMLIKFFIEIKKEGFINWFKLDAEGDDE